MGRKSLATVRKNQILDAFEQCIVTYGLHASSLSKVAKTAGVQLSGIHHFIGNREDLVRAMVDRYTKSYSADLETFYNDNSHTLDGILEFMFSSFRADSDDYLIFNDLFNTSLRDPKIRKILNKVYEYFVKRFTDVIRDNYDSASPEECRECSEMIISLWYGHRGMISIDISPSSLPGSAKKSAEAILKTLE